MNSSTITIDGVDLQETSHYQLVDVMWLYRWDLGAHSAHARYDKFKEKLSREEWLELARLHAASQLRKLME